MLNVQPTNHPHRIAEGHIALDLVRVVCNHADCFPQGDSVMTDVFLYNQGGNLTARHRNPAVPQLLAVVIQAVSKANAFQRLQRGYRSV